MIRTTLIRRLGVSVAFVAAVSLAGAAMAATPPSSTHASSTAVNAVANHPTGDSEPDTDTGQDAHALAVSTAAGSDIVGGAHQNHGGYVSCVARGGSECTSTTPTLPSHGAPELPTQATVPTR